MCETISVLIAGDDEDLINHLVIILDGQKYNLVIVNILNRTVPPLDRRCDVGFLAVCSCDEQSISLLESMLESLPDLPIIVAASNPALDSALEMIRSGARDLIYPPLDLLKLESAIGRILVKAQPAKTDTNEIDKLLAQVSEKEVLLREIHHRVKNNLMVVSSLLSIGAKRAEDDQAKQMFRECQNRIFVMARIHQHLYLSDCMSQVEMQQYLPYLVDRVRFSFGAKNTVLDIDIAESSLPMKLAILCGLVVNELVTNSLKHAFPDETAPNGAVARIGVSLSTGKNWELAVSDNGIGSMNENPEQHNSTGIELIQVLVKQLGGMLHIESIPKQGTTVRITFNPHLD
ncbi:MAG: hypothetical protein JXA42_05990 [Anaerolineales bacterium]|nr:hypothetical protein [Anaerolineales bacterium]